MLKPRSEFWQKQIYANQLERLELLHNLVVDGKDAEAVLKYAEMLRKEAEKEVLEALAKPNANLQEMQSYYRLTMHFCDMLNHAAMTGKRKEQDYNKLKAELQKEE